MDKLNWPMAFVIGITFISGTIIASSSINARDVAGAGGETLFKQIVAVLDNSHVFQTGQKGKHDFAMYPLLRNSNALIG